MSRFYEVDRSKIQAKRAQYEKSSTTTVFQQGFWDPKEGQNTIRILPPWSEERIWYREVPYHYGVGGKSVICPKRLLNKPCYVCEKVAEFRRSDSKELNKRAEDLRPKMRIYYNIIDLSESNKGVQIYGSGINVFRDLLSYDLDPEWGQITDPDEGYDINLFREGQGRSSKYQVKAKKSPSKLQNMEWLNQLRDLDNLIAGKVLGYDELRTLYESVLGEEIPILESVSFSSRKELEDIPIEIPSSSSRKPLQNPKPSLITEEPEIEEVEIEKPNIEESTYLTADDIRKLSYKELKVLIKENNLDIDPRDFDTDSELQDAIIQKCGLEEMNTSSAISESETTLEEITSSEDESTSSEFACFGLEYNEKDPECASCSARKECEIKFKKKKKR